MKIIDEYGIRNRTMTYDQPSRIVLSLFFVFVVFSPDPTEAQAETLGTG